MLLVCARLPVGAMSLPEAISGLRKIVGDDAVLDRPEDLMLYEYDAGVRKSTPGAVVFPQNAQHVSQIMQLAAAAKIPVVARGAGTGLERRRDLSRGRHCRRLRANESRSRSRCREPARRGAARRGQSAALGIRLASRALLRARSLQPESLHHRRQCRRELRRPAHAAARRHRESRHRRRGRAAQRRDRAVRRQGCRIAMATI